MGIKLGLSYYPKYAKSRPSCRGTIYLMLTPDEVAHGIKYGGMSEFVLIHSLELQDSKVDNNLTRPWVIDCHPTKYVYFFA